MNRDGCGLPARSFNYCPWGTVHRAMYGSLFSIFTSRVEIRAERPHVLSATKKAPHQERLFPIFDFIPNNGRFWPQASRPRQACKGLHIPSVPLFLPFGHGKQSLFPCENCWPRCGRGGGLCKSRYSGPVPYCHGV